MPSLTSQFRREYNSWNGARYRCRSEKHPAWDDYGGRGIQMCERWANSFAAFLEDMGERPEGTEIDRIDNDGHYEPGNCRWVSRTENSRNKYRANPKPQKPRKAKRPNAGEVARLARLDRIDATFDKRLEPLLERVARIEAERDAIKAGVIEKIRPQFRPES